MILIYKSHQVIGIYGYLHELDNIFLFFIH